MKKKNLIFIPLAVIMTVPAVFWIFNQNKSEMPTESEKLANSQITNPQTELQPEPLPDSDVNPPPETIAKPPISPLPETQSTVVNSIDNHLNQTINHQITIPPQLESISDPIIATIVELDPQPIAQLIGDDSSPETQKNEDHPPQCDLEAGYIIDDNGKCIVEEVPIEQPTQTPPEVQPAQKEHPNHYILEDNIMCTKSIPPVCGLSLRIAVDIDQPNETRLRQELERIALNHFEGLGDWPSKSDIKNIGITGHYYNGSDFYVDYHDEESVRITLNT